MAIGEYTEQGIRKVVGNDHPLIVIVPIMPSDVPNNPDMEAFEKGQTREGALYHRGTPGILRMSGTAQMSHVGKGLVLLHELDHANNDMAGSFNDKNDELAHWREELSVFEFEQRLMHNLGGSEYDAMLAHEVDQMRELYQDPDGRGGRVPQLSAAANLDVLFGPLSSDHERDTLRSAVWFEVIQQVFEERYGNEAGHIDTMRFIQSRYAAK